MVVRRRSIRTRPCGASNSESRAIPVNTRSGSSVPAARQRAHRQMHLEIGGFRGGSHRCIGPIFGLEAGDETPRAASVDERLKNGAAVICPSAASWCISATSASLVVRLAIGILAGSRSGLSVESLRRAPRCHCPPPSKRDDVWARSCLIRLMTLSKSSDSACKRTRRSRPAPRPVPATTKSVIRRLDSYG